MYCVCLNLLKTAWVLYSSVEQARHTFVLDWGSVRSSLIRYPAARLLYPMIRIACHLGFGHLKRLPSKSHLQVLSQPIPPLLNPSRRHLNLPLTNLKEQSVYNHSEMLCWWIIVIWTPWDVSLWCQRPPIAILLGGRTHDSCPAALLLLCRSFFLWNW